MAQARILVMANDRITSRALGYILEREDWHVELEGRPEAALRKLAAGGWHLVIADLRLVVRRGRLLALLEELAEASTSLRVLFLVEEEGEPRALTLLEKLGLPYATRPLRLHEFLEQVTELLHQAGALSDELYYAHAGPAPPRPHLKVRRRHEEGGPQMFASREGYDYDYDEEEIRRFEEEEEEKKRKARGEAVRAE